MPESEVEGTALAIVPVPVSDAILDGLAQDLATLHRRTALEFALAVGRLAAAGHPVEE